MQVYSNVSSAKSDIVFCFPLTSMPIILSLVLIFSSKGSLTMSNKRGKRGPHCLVPRPTANRCDLIPLVTTAEVGEE